LNSSKYDKLFKPKLSGFPGNGFCAQFYDKDDPTDYGKQQPEIGFCGVTGISQAASGQRDHRNQPKNSQHRNDPLAKANDLLNFPRHAHTDTNAHQNDGTEQTDQPNRQVRPKGRYANITFEGKRSEQKVSPFE
jgi:hypothetical protein